MEGLPVNTKEAELIKGCIGNDRLSQKALYDRYKDLMFTIALRITNDREMASDALQEAFIEVFRCLHQFRGPHGLKSWIRTILIRSAIREIRKDLSSIPITGDMEALNSDLIVWPDQLNGSMLSEAIGRLPPLHRSVFVMSEIEGYHHSEIAEILDISSQNSRVLLHRARKQLQMLIQPLL